MHQKFLIKIVSCLSLSLLLSSCTTTGSSPAAERAPAQQSVASKSPKSAEAERAKVHTDLGSLYMLEGRLAVALEEGKIALEADSSYAPAYNLLGLANMVLGENKLAAENFERALSLAPGDPEFSNNYGWLLCQTGQERRSFDYFLRAARNPLYGTPTKAYTNLGICQAQIKDYKNAETSLMQASRMAPTNTLALFYLAQVTFQQGQYAQAKNWIQAIERQIELTSEATWLALNIERKQGSREGEARYSSHLRKRFPTSPETQKLLRGEFE